MIEQEWKLLYYAAENDRIPFWEWFESLSDVKAQAAIDGRLTRLRLGHFGKCEPVGNGVLELKIYYGPGYRVYFGIAGRQVILLISGGDKSTQKKDIQKAKLYWNDYKVRRAH